MAIPVALSSFRLLMPEAIWLEPEQLEQARLVSDRAIDEGTVAESNQWQIYLDALAQQGFQQWLRERMPNTAPQPLRERAICSDYSSGDVRFLKIDEFRLCLITIEHLLDEVVSVPEAVIGRADFYVVLEVSEEQAQVIVRGFLGNNQLTDCIQPLQLRFGSYQLPIALFDAEPNHLLFYCRVLEPATRSAVQLASPGMLESLRETRVKLSRWLQGMFDQEWRAIDDLFASEANSALSLRSFSDRQKRGKLIDLGMKLGNESIALLVNVAASDQKLGVLVQVHPTNGKRYLPSDLKLTLLSKAGKVLQETTARHQDNYIQLKQFKGEPGKQFSVQVSLQDARFTEEFEL